MARSFVTHRVAVALAAAVLHGVARSAEPLAELDAIGRKIADRPCEKPRVTSVMKKNIHDEAVRDRYITYHCTRASSEIIRSSLSNYKTTIPLFASTSQIDSRLPQPYRVGEPIAKIKALLGTPEVEKADSVTYLLPSETREETVSFMHEGGRVTRIAWAWYFD